MRRLRPTITLRAIAIATVTPRRRRDTESAFEAFARLAAASGPWMLWFGTPPFPTAHDRDRNGL
jgi:hypothetical protein